MKKRTYYLLAIIALQVILLLSIVAKHQYVVYAGQPITLKTAPIDPTDPFYGDYVTLHYEVNEIERQKVRDELTAEEHGSPVYVLLERKQQPWYEAIGVYRKRPVPGDNQAVIKGVLQYVDEDRIYLEYGWERYYVPENTGREIEQQESMLVDLRVSGTGDAVITGIRW